MSPARDRVAGPRRIALLAIKTPSKRAARARLLLDLDELATIGWAALDAYMVVRRIERAASARRSLYRLKKTLAQEGVQLEIVEENGIVTANFGARAIMEFLEADLRDARGLVERLDAARERRDPDMDGLAAETELMSPEALAADYRERRKTFGWIAHRYGVGTWRVRRMLAATGSIPSRAESHCVEIRRQRDVVERALRALLRRAPVDEIAAILSCSRRTAQRFMKRQGCTLLPGRPRRRAPRTTEIG